ncbi:TlpA disulfide reductase family protein [Solidesulfovibrio sp.]|uniref:peroxiredoxin family protein n=1 Tax=Solidesulfovibrio sp. TaxID=2910990 RepID=UPI0026147CF1|nr:TlpA disulfide reductase family protein [Solidesulfovibrio sp.]
MKRLFCLLVVACLAMLSAAPALAVEASEAPGAKPLAVGSAFPDVTLVGELSPEAAASLGLAPGPARASLNSLRPEVLVFEVFSMYCPFCQKDAPSVNALNELVAKRGLSNRIAVIGVGAGNSATEVEVFRKTFAVPFPLFADPDFAVHGQVGKVGTPFFYVLKKKPDGGYVVAGASLGVMDSPAEFLSRITRAAGI